MNLEIVYLDFQRTLGKLTDIFFTRVNMESASIENKKIVTDLKENYTLTRQFGPMNISFDDYPPYSGAISQFLKQILMHILIFVVGTFIEYSKTS